MVVVPGEEGQLSLYPPRADRRAAQAGRGAREDRRHHLAPLGPSDGCFIVERRPVAEPGTRSCGGGRGRPSRTSIWRRRSGASTTRRRASPRPRAATRRSTTSGRARPRPGRTSSASRRALGGAARGVRPGEAKTSKIHPEGSGAYPSDDRNPTEGDACSPCSWTSISWNGGAVARPSFAGFAIRRLDRRGALRHRGRRRGLHGLVRHPLSGRPPEGMYNLVGGLREVLHARRLVLLPGVRPVPVFCGDGGVQVAHELRAARAPAGCDPCAASWQSQHTSSGTCSMALAAVRFILWLMIMFTGKAPERLVNFRAMCIRSTMRYYAYMFLLVDRCPSSRSRGETPRHGAACRLTSRDAGTSRRRRRLLGAALATCSRAAAADVAWPAGSEPGPRDRRGSREHPLPAWRGAGGWRRPRRARPAGARGAGIVAVAVPSRHFAAALDACVAGLGPGRCWSRWRRGSTPRPAGACRACSRPASTATRARRGALRARTMPRRSRAARPRVGGGRRVRGAMPRLQAALSTSRFRVYANADLVGVELCAAAKNVIAIAAGRPTATATATTPRRPDDPGLAEMSRLGAAFGTNRAPSPAWPGSATSSSPAAPTTRATGAPASCWRAASPGRPGGAHRHGRRGRRHSADLRRIGREHGSTAADGARVRRARGLGVDRRGRRGPARACGRDEF